MKLGVHAGVASLVAAGMLLAGQTHALEAQTSPVGVWNLRSRLMTDRATGGVRVVLLRVEDSDGELQGEITSIRNTFVPVEAIRYERGELHVTYGSYEYTLHPSGDDIEGTVVSPLGTQEIEGFRQRKTLLYVGDEPEPFRTTRPGVIGVRGLGAPPADASDPNAWARSHIDSVGDLVLIAGGRVKIPVPFANASEFGDDLLTLAGKPVTVVGTWEGTTIRIESISPSS